MVGALLADRNGSSQSGGLWTLFNFCRRSGCKKLDDVARELGCDKVAGGGGLTGKGWSSSRWGEAESSQPVSEVLKCSVGGR